MVLELPVGNGNYTNLQTVNCATNNQKYLEENVEVPYESLNTSKEIRGEVDSDTINKLETKNDSDEEKGSNIYSQSDENSKSGSTDNKTFQITQKTRNNCQTIGDSDSEEDPLQEKNIEGRKQHQSQMVLETNLEHKVPQSSETYFGTKKKHKRLTIVDSDSEEENKVLSETTSSSDQISDTLLPEKNIELKKQAILETDLELEHTLPQSSETYFGTKKKHKRLTIADSDSEEENQVLSETTSSSDQISDTLLPEENIELKKQAILETDLELEHTLPQSSETYFGTKKKHKRLTIADSDSEEENKVLSETTSTSSHQITDIHQPVIYTTNHKGEIIPEYTVQQKPNWSALCDPESDDEVHQSSEIFEENNGPSTREDIIQPVSYKKKHQSKNEEKNQKKLTGREAAQQRKVIQSESQRMVREMNVSLPYHRPKSYTLKEFLARRPKFASAVPVPAKTPPSVAIKMSGQQLEIISKQLEQHEKEVKEFYKSESEPEDDDDKDYVPPGPEKNEPECLREELTDMDTMLPNEEEKLEDTVHDSGIDTQEIVPNSSEEINDISEEDIAEHLPKTGAFREEVKGCSDSEFALENSSKETASGSEHIDKVARTVTQEEIDQSNECLAQSCIESEFNNSVEKMQVMESTESSKNSIKTTEMSEKSTEPQTDQYSRDHEFSLDDIEENSEKLPQADGNGTATQKDDQLVKKDDQTRTTAVHEQHSENKSEPLEECFADDLNNHSSKFQYTDLDREIENFGDAEKPVETEKPKPSRLDLIREKLTNIHPRLSGGVNEVIDLDTEIARPNEVTKLMERFMQHTTKKHALKNKVKLSIISVESGEIHKETVAMSVDDEDSQMEIEEKPGAKLQKLRDELQNQMILQRSEMWQKKSAQEVPTKDIDQFEEEKSDCGMEDAFLDDDEEEEISESSEEENEIEQEEEQSSDKFKSAFLDNEAEESDREDAEGHTVNDGDDEDESEEEIDCNSIEDVEEKPIKKTLRRIVKGFTEDSDEEEENLDLISQSNIAEAAEGSSKNNEEQVSQDDDYFPPHQPQNFKSPVRNLTSHSKSEFDFLTPVTYITGLQNLNSASKTKNSSTVSPFQMQNVPSPLKEVNWHSDLQKKLFADTEITNSQAEAMAELCSGKTPFTQELDNEDISFRTTSSSQSEIPCTVPPKTQDLLNICSGDFVDNSQAEVSSSAPPTSQDLLDICSGEFTGISQVITSDDSRSALETHTFSSAAEVKSLGAEEGMIISQLLDEEEMEKFKRKFDSPLMTNTQRRIVEEFEEVVASGGTIDSDDDEVLAVKKKKNQKKLAFSDDDCSDDEPEEETIDLHDDIEEDEDDIPADNIGYDSEENEVEYVDNEENVKLKPADFLDKEAELSESEWGSADEDEKDLDTMEYEQGDTEKFDEKKLRSDLERIHMRRMLDDDTREVKLLQEILLEDGELHGSGRERQFRWKNINSVDDGDEGKKEENEDGYLDEEESEEKWRKKRHEIEMFLQEKQSRSRSLTDDSNDILSDSQLLKIGHQVIQTSSQCTTPVDKPKVDPVSPDIKSTFSFLNKRGSFLSRSDQVLQRLVDYNKSSTTVNLKTAKNSRNFLFQTVTMEETILTNGEKKRKAADGTPKVLKKLRLSDNISPAVNRKKSSDTPKAKAKLLWK